jgi:hypothetical protein
LVALILCFAGAATSAFGAQPAAENILFRFEGGIAGKPITSILDESGTHRAVVMFAQPAFYATNAPSALEVGRPNALCAGFNESLLGVKRQP